MDFSDCLGTRSSWKGTASAVPQIILSQTALQAPEKASFSRDGLQRLLGNAVLVEGHGFSRAANNTAADGFTDRRKSQLFEGMDFRDCLGTRSSWKGTSFSRASKWNFHRQLYQPHKKPAFRGMDFSDCLGTRSSWKGTASAVPQIILSQTALQAPEKASFS